MNRGVTAGCILFVLALSAHILISCLAHFTEIRFEINQHRTVERTPTIVGATPDITEIPGSIRPVESLTQQNTSDQTETIIAVQEDGEELHKAGDIDLNRILSAANSWMRTIHQVAIIAGIIGLAFLVIQTTLGFLVAANAYAHTGLARLASAQVWSITLVALAIPWHLIVAGPGYHGLFLSYEMLIDTLPPDATSLDQNYVQSAYFYLQCIIFPGLGILIASTAMHSFNLGIKGLLPDVGPSDFEIAIDKEASGREAGSISSTGRTSGALTSTMFENQTAALPPATQTNTASASPNHKQAQLHPGAARPRPLITPEEPEKYDDRADGPRPI